MVRVATFNCENLFARYNFKEGVSPRGDGFGINDCAFEVYDETAKRITAQSIKEVDADIIALQEIESLPILDRFNSRYLPTMGYVHRILVDSHDPRNIDVALLSRYPITAIRSHRHERSAKSRSSLFSRDCLEVTMEADGKSISLYVNHFKSMIGGREQTKAKRVEQVGRVAEIIDERWKAGGYDGNYVVLGDFNDYVDDDTSLTALTDHPGLVNVSERMPDTERWTHFYAGGDEYRQLDFLLLSKSLAEANPGAPEVMRKGLPHRAVDENHIFEPFDTVGEDEPKASDHAPIYMDVELA